MSQAIAELRYHIECALPFKAKPSGKLPYKVLLARCDFRDVVTAAWQTPYALPKGVGVVRIRGVPATSVRLRVEGLGDVLVYGDRPRSLAEGIGDVAACAIEVHERSDRTGPPRPFPGSAMACARSLTAAPQD